MRRDARRWMGAIAFGLSVGCGLFPDLSSLGNTADASSGGDSTSADVSTPDSGGSEGGSEGGSAGFCLTHPGHTFCEDFDEPNFAARWDGVKTSAGATAVEDAVLFVSPPNSLLATLPCPAGGGGTAYATKHFATTSQITIHAQLLVDSTALSEMDPLMIVFNPPPAGYSDYEIHIDPADQHLGYVATPSDGGAQVHLDTSFTSSLTAWHDVEVDLTLATGAIEILVDGVQVTSWTVAPASPTAFDLRLGIVRTTNPTGSLITQTARVDNVLVDIK